MDILTPAQRILRDRPFDALNVATYGISYPKVLQSILDCYEPLYQYISKLADSHLSYDNKPIQRVKFFHFCIIVNILFRVERDIIAQLAKGSFARAESLQRVQKNLESLTTLLNPAYATSTNTHDILDEWDLTPTTPNHKDRIAINEILHLVGSADHAIRYRQIPPFNNEYEAPPVREHIIDFRAAAYDLLNSFTKAAVFLSQSKNSDTYPTTNEEAMIEARDLQYASLLWGYSVTTGWTGPRKGSDAIYKQILAKVVELFEKCAPYASSESKGKYHRDYIERAVKQYQKIPNQPPINTNIGILRTRTIAKMLMRDQPIINLFTD